LLSRRAEQFTTEADSFKDLDDVTRAEVTMEGSRKQPLSNNVLYTTLSWETWR